MIKFFLFLILLSCVSLACSKGSSNSAMVSLDIQKIHDLMVKGNYDDALKLATEISSKTPPSPDADQALYLQGYILAYDKADLQNSRPPLRRLLANFPKSPILIPTQKLISDSQYWQGHYPGAIEEYKKLAQIGDPSLALYAKLQIGNCLLLDDKVEEALAHFRELIEKNPGTPTAESAQLMIANTYIKLQNIPQAKKELKKLIAQSQDHDIQESAQKALRQIEEEASFDKAEHRSK